MLLCEPFLLNVRFRPDTSSFYFSLLLLKHLFIIVDLLYDFHNLNSLSLQWNFCNLKLQEENKMFSIAEINQSIWIKMVKWDFLFWESIKSTKIKIYTSVKC